MTSTLCVQSSFLSVIQEGNDPLPNVLWLLFWSKMATIGYYGVLYVFNACLLESDNILFYVASFAFTVQVKERRFDLYSEGDILPVVFSILSKSSIPIETCA